MLNVGFGQYLHLVLSFGFIIVNNSNDIIFAHIKTVYGVRSDIGWDGEDFIKIENNVITTILEKHKGKWRKFEFNGDNGWVSKSLDDLSSRYFEIIFQCNDFNIFMAKYFDCFLEAKYNE